MQIGSFSLIKELNTSLILKTIREKKSISRADIAKITGLTPATVTNITSELIDNRIIVETMLGKSNGGRKSVLLEFNHTEYNVVGVVISRHKITVTLTDLEANLICDKTSRIKGNISPKDAIKIIKDLIGQVLAVSEKRVLGIGISMEGLIDDKNGICVLSSNFGWENTDIKGEIEEEFSLPVFVNNDVKAITLGEKFYGSAKNSSDFILLCTGYGIGASLVNNGHIYRGASNYASEMGHMTIDINGPECSCGNRGCFQALASGSALIKEIKENNLDKKYFPDGDITADKIIKKHREGVSEITLLLEKQAFYIGVGLSNIINVFNPSLIIISGYICKANEKITASILSEIKKRSLKSMLKDVNVIFSKLGSEGLYKGATALFVSEFIENPEIYF